MPPPLLSYEQACANHLHTEWDDHEICSPWFLGRRTLTVPLATLVPYIDWPAFVSACRHTGILATHDDHDDGTAVRGLRERAGSLLDRIVRESLLTARGVYGFWPANTIGDDIVLYADDSRRRELARLPMLRRQTEGPQGEPNLSLADYVAPRDSLVPDYLGMFAVTAGVGLNDLVQSTAASQEEAAVIEALAGSLAAAFAEYLHAEARRSWGYGERERLTIEELLQGKYRGIRPAFGDACCPDGRETVKVLQILDAASQGITDDDRGGLSPAASLAGLYFSHPRAALFDIGPLGRDQIESYAARQGQSAAEIEARLAASLSYEPPPAGS